MTKRTNDTPDQGTAVPRGELPNGVHAMRRGGARREVTERVTFRAEDGRTFEGWALNVSRGGLRVIVEEKVSLGEKFDVALGAESEGMAREGRIVWVQEEPDGAIVGIEFIALSGTHKSSLPPEPAPPARDGDES